MDNDNDMCYTLVLILADDFILLKRKHRKLDTDCHTHTHTHTPVHILYS